MVVQGFCKGPRFPFITPFLATFRNEVEKIPDAMRSRYEELARQFIEASTPYYQDEDLR